MANHIDRFRHCQCKYDAYRTNPSELVNIITTTGAMRPLNPSDLHVQPQTVAEVLHARLTSGRCGVLASAPARKKPLPGTRGGLDRTSG